MDLSKSLTSIKENVMTISGMSEKDVAALQSSVEANLVQYGIDQTTLGMLLLALAGFVLLGVLLILTKRSANTTVDFDASQHEDRIAYLEQMIHDLKTQLSMVKSQVKADFGFMRQEVNEVKASISQIESIPYHREETSQIVANER